MSLKPRHHHDHARVAMFGLRPRFNSARVQAVFRLQQLMSASSHMNGTVLGLFGRDALAADARSRGDHTGKSFRRHVAGCTIWRPARRLMRPGNSRFNVAPAGEKSRMKCSGAGYSRLFRRSGRALWELAHNPSWNWARPS